MAAVLISWIEGFFYRFVLLYLLNSADVRWFGDPVGSDPQKSSSLIDSKNSFKSFISVIICAVLVISFHFKKVFLLSHFTSKTEGKTRTNNPDFLNRIFKILSFLASPYHSHELKPICRKIESFHFVFQGQQTLATHSIFCHK